MCPTKKKSTPIRICFSPASNRRIVSHLAYSVLPVFGTAELSLAEFLAVSAIGLIVVEGVSRPRFLL